MEPFVSSARNVHSQYGEDGLLEWLLGELGLTAGFFVEFGAWDGRHLSNCRLLFEKGWGGCFIEGDPTRYKDLVGRYESAKDRIRPVCAFVSAEGPDSLDSILEREGVESIDLLSIDIDSDDYAVWKGVRKHRPKVVIIEYNPTIPFDTRYVNPRGRNRGNSALSLVELGVAKGYRLVAGTRGNLVFIEAENENERLPTISLQQLKDAVGGGFRFFFGMDGTLLREAGHTIRETEIFRVPWSEFMAAQPVPRFLRTFDAQPKLKKIVSGLILLLTRPLATIRMLREERANPRPPERNVYESNSDEPVS